MGAKTVTKGTQRRLPTMEDPRIEELHSAAIEYAAVRDERIEQNKAEKKLMEKLAGLMKKHSKTKYLCQGVEIKRVIEKERIKVRIKKAKPQS
jgi:hypothetical protein